MRERKQANQLNEYVESLLSGKRLKIANPAYAYLIEAAVQVSECKIGLDAAARERIWANVKSELAATMSKSGFSARLAQRFEFLRNKPLVIRLATAFITLTVAMGSLNYAAAQSLPGSFLYPVKRVFEKVLLVTSLSPASKVERLIGQSEIRLSEAKTVAKRGKRNDVQELVHDIDRSVKEANALIKVIEIKTIKKHLKNELDVFILKLNHFKEGLNKRTEEKSIEREPQEQQKVLSKKIENNKNVALVKVTVDKEEEQDVVKKIKSTKLNEENSKTQKKESEKNLDDNECSENVKCTVNEGEHESYNNDKDKGKNQRRKCSFSEKKEHDKYNEQEKVLNLGPAS